MRGDRLDDMLTDLPYDLLAGQWGGIRLRGVSYGNILEWCDIHGGSWGILADSAGTDQPKLSIESSIIHNVSGNCIEATGCRISVANSQITNAGVTCVDLAGGASEFTFCTIAGFSLWSLGRQAVLLTDSRSGLQVPFDSASFSNCIITGRHETEFVTVFADSVAGSAAFSISNSLLMVKDRNDSRYRDVVFEDRESKMFGPYNFVDTSMRGYASIFLLDEKSPARGIADNQSADWPIDLAGNPRPPTGADAGCFQYHQL
jgi:hypothetical protein